MKNKKDWCCIEGNKIVFRDKAFYSSKYDYTICNYKIKGKNPIIVSGDSAELNKNYWGLPKMIFRKVKIKIYNPIMEIQ